MTDYLIPALIVALCLLALRKQEDAFSTLLEGSAEGLKLALSLLPTLVVLMTAVHMLRSSGAIELLGKLPLFGWLGIPPETAMLVLIRPISGSGALAVGTELMAAYGPDSLIGKTAAVMLGSTETTFYVLSIYCGAAGIKKTRYALPAALIADLTGFVVASACVRYY